MICPNQSQLFEETITFKLSLEQNFTGVIILFSMHLFSAYPQQQMSMQPPMQQQMPQQMPQGPGYTEEDFKQVKDMFPNMEDEVITSVFAANNGNKETTIVSLLQMSAD